MSIWLVCGYALAVLVLGILLTLKLYAPYL
jgi:hypothetical protein